MSNSAPDVVGVAEVIAEEGTGFGDPARGTSGGKWTDLFSPVVEGMSDVSLDVATRGACKIEPAGLVGGDSSFRGVDL